MTTAVIVQARMASTRLPGKVMLQAAGRTFLDWCLTRCLAIPDVDVVCCATVDRPDCDELAAEAARIGAHVYRGDQTDVLGRYLAAAREIGADVVLRVTSDCPLVEPALCAEVLSVRKRLGVEYACNNMPSSWPHGLDCEAFTMDALAAAAAIADSDEEHEHVTPGLRTRSEFSRACVAGPGGDWERLRLTLDTDADLVFLRELLAVLPTADATLAEVGQCLTARPDLLAAGLHPAGQCRVQAAAETVVPAAVAASLPELQPI